MNFVKFAQDNQKKRGYKIVSINNDMITIQCKTCNAIKTMKLSSLYRYESAGTHNEFCSRYWLKIGREEIGDKAMKCFHDCYRRAHERCYNPNCKDYVRYKGKFGFRDFSEYYLTCFDDFKQSIKTILLKDITIDRIDGSKKYEPNNVRFVSMLVNLQNKPNVIPVKMTNIVTNEVIKGASFEDLARKYKNISYASALHRACKNNRLYKKTWKVEYDNT